MNKNRALAAGVLAVAMSCLSSEPAAAGDLRSIVRGFERAYAQDDPAAAAAAVAALYANNASLGGDFFGGFVLQGPAMIEQSEASLFASFCNAEWVPTNVVENGDRKLSIEYTLSVDFCGPFPGPDGRLIQPTGERFSLKLATFIRTNSSDKIVEEYRHANVQAFYDALMGM